MKIMRRKLRRMILILYRLPSRWRMVAFLSWLVGGLLVGAVYGYWQWREWEDRFDKESELIASHIETQLRQNEHVLNSIVGLFESLRVIDLEDIRQYAAHLLKPHPQLQSFEFVSPVPYHLRPQFEMSWSILYQQPFHIREFHFGEAQPWRIAPDRALYAPIVFREPPEKQYPFIIGLDLLQHPILQRTVARALRHPNAVASGGFVSIQRRYSYMLMQAIRTDNIIHPMQGTEQAIVVLLVDSQKLIDASTHKSNLGVTLTMRHTDGKESMVHPLYQSKASDHSSIWLPRFQKTLGLPSESQPFVLDFAWQTRWQHAQWTYLLFGWAVVWAACFFLMRGILQKQRTQRQQQQAEASLRRQRELAKVTLEAIGDGVITFNRQQQVEYINPIACQLLQLDEGNALGKPLQELFTVRTQSGALPDNLFAYCLQEAKAIEFGENARLQRQGHTLLHVEGMISPLFSNERRVRGGVLTFRNIGPVRQRAMEALAASEQRIREHEVQLAHVGRLHTMGEMASGIAHEINQPLSAILSYSQACLRLLDEPEEDIEFNQLQRAMQAIANQAQRAGSIIHRLRQFITRRPVNIQAISINQVVGDVLELADHELQRKHVKVQCHLAPDLPLVMADSIQLEQIALNLLRNGMDAVEFMGHLGELTLHTSSDSGMVRLSIADNGKGIAKGDFEKLFQPFFTNKASGMGLGLTICQTIAQSFGGSLKAQNLPHGGANFILSLPIASMNQNDYGHHTPHPNP